MSLPLPTAADRSTADVDRGLVSQIEAGRGGAFDELYRRHQAAAFRLARSLCRDEGRAQEAVQDAFMEVWNHPARYAAQRGAVAGWIMCIVRYRALDVVRRNVKHASHRADAGEIELHVAPGATALTVADRDEADRLTSLLATLPDRQQEVIALAFYGQLTHIEIAARLHLPPGTVKGRMRLGLQTLRGDLQQAEVAERWHGVLTGAFYDGHLDRALEVVREATSEMPAATMLDDVLAPAMHAIGSLWERSEITIADEQRASATCDRLLAEVAPLLEVATANSRETVVFAPLDGERHTFGLRMAGSVLAGAGYDTVVVAPGTTTAQLRIELDRHRPAMVALSTTMSHPGTLAATLGVIHDTVPGAHTITGGSAAPDVGPDATVHHVARLDTMVSTVTGLLRPPARRRPPAQGSPSGH